MVFEIISGFEERALESGHAWECLTCGKCQVNCPQGVDFLSMVRDVRSKMKMKGVNPVVAHDSLLSPIYSIMLNPNVKPKKTMYLSDDVETDPESKTLFFVGCSPVMGTHFEGDVGFDGAAVMNDSIKALNIIGITPAVTDDEKCCAHDYQWRGERAVFEAFGKQNIESLKKYDTIPFHILIGICGVSKNISNNSKSQESISADPCPSLEAGDVLMHVRFVPANECGPGVIS